MRSPSTFGIVALGLVVALSVGCVGGSPDPLTIEERLLPVADAPGFELSEDFSWRTAQEAITHSIGNGFNEATVAQAVELFEATGFVAGAGEVLSKVEGATRDNFLGFVVFQFGSEEGAQDVHEFLHADDLKPMPGSCTVGIAEFEVDDVPNATGVARTLLEGGAGQICADRYLVDFTDGAFLYLVERVLPAGIGSNAAQDEAIGFAKALYERVKGAPPASS
ncbi:MAG TPA: hypothetical protein VJR05_09375 [Acidimicrobiia bacterium]|nr:hypothetical protein [Acidimicrobiia bacterium]